MIVGGQAGFFQAHGLLVGQHAERAADFHTKLGNPADHFEDLIELRAMRSFAPRRAHAHAGNSARRRFARSGDDVSRIEQALALNVGLVVRALRAIGAIFRAATRLDGNELAGLHSIGRVEMTMNAGCAENQFGERQMVNQQRLAPWSNRDGGQCRHLLPEQPGSIQWSFSIRLIVRKRESYSRETSYHWLFTSEQFRWGKKLRDMQQNEGMAVQGKLGEAPPIVTHGLTAALRVS